MKKLFFLLILLTGLLPALTAAEEIYSFGIVPQQSASKLAKNWGPIMAHISRQTGVTLRFKTAPNIPEFEKRLLAGEYDFAYMNPYHYVVFNQAPGYQAMAKARDKKITGIMVTRKDSTINQLTQLQDKTLAFPSPAAFAASILPRAELKKQQVNISPKYVSSHDSVYRGVASGLFPAGGGVKRTFNAVDAGIREQLQIFWTSEGYTPHAIAYHPRINDALATKVTQSLVALEQTEAGQKMLGTLKIKGWEAASDEQWNDIRALNIQTLDDLTQ